MTWNSNTWAEIIEGAVREMREDSQILPFIYLTDHLPVDIGEDMAVEVLSDDVVLLKTKIGEKTYINTDHILYVDVKLG